MKNTSAAFLLRRFMFLFSFGILLSGSPSMAQISQVDPNDSIGTDDGTPRPADSNTVPGYPAPTGPIDDGVPTDPAYEGGTENGTPGAPAPTSDPDKTFQKDDLIGAAEGVFGKGAAGLGGLIEKILKKQGEPNGYITGREGGGAFVVGLRYGSGTLSHKVEGERPVYWTGPSIGFDAGANAGSTFVLVYNLYDTEDLYRRYPSGEGVAYLVGGFNASYLRRGDIVLAAVLIIIFNDSRTDHRNARKSSMRFK
jgi:hypothetical protein